MVRDYWRRVHRRALRTAAERLGFVTAERVVLNLAGAALAIAALVFWGSADASRDEMLARSAGIALVVLFFPMFYVWELIAAPARMEAELIAAGKTRETAFEAVINKLKIDNRSLQILSDPESVKSSPRYMKLKFLLDPQTGSITPGHKMTLGLEELRRLSGEFIAGDYEAYYLAVHVGDWVRTVGRQFFGSGDQFQKMQYEIIKELELLYDRRVQMFNQD